MKMRMSGALAALLITAAHPALALTEAECVQAFEKADADKNGTVTQAEATKYYESLPGGPKPVVNADLSKESFVTNCKSAVTTAAKTDPGAPLEGANSFTEGQAKDRVAAAGFTDVSTLAKDDKGIWRGTAKKSGNQVNVSVDFRGNVVSN